MTGDGAKNSDKIRRRNVLRGLAGAGFATVGAMGSAAGTPHGSLPGNPLGGSNGGNDGGDDCTFVVDKSGQWDFTTISGALEAAEPGDVICVLAGEYEEQLVVDTEDIVIWGASQPSNQVVRASDTVVDVQADGFVMGKLTIDAADATGVSAADGTVVRNSRILTEGTVGVEATDLGTLGLIGNEFVDGEPLPSENPPPIDEPEGVAVHAQRVRGERDGDDQGFSFIRNTVEGYIQGLYLVDCFRVLFRQSVFTNNLYQGIRFQTSPTGSAGFVFYDRNEFRDNYSGTIIVEGGNWEENSSTISEVYAEGNVFDNDGYGIFSAVGFVTVENDDDGNNGGNGGGSTPVLDDLLGNDGGGGGSDGGDDDEDSSDDDDGTTRWIVPGPLSGEEAVLAPCNYWGHPTGPTRRDNPLSNRNFFTRKVADRGDRVTEGVDVRPWHVQPVETEEELVCQGGRISDIL